MANGGNSGRALERQVRGAAQDVASAVETRLDADARDREQHEQAVFDRVTGIFGRIDELQDPTRQAELADAVSAVSNELARLRGDLESRLDRALANEQQLAELGAALDRALANEQQLAE